MIAGNPSGLGEQGDAPRTAWWRLACSLIVFGSLAAGFCVFDLARPGHFVGDMYGLEVLVRLALLAVPTAMLMVAAILFRVGWAKNNRTLYRGAIVPLFIAAVLLAVMAKGVAVERQRDAAHKRYPLKSTAELLHLARGQHDQYAIDELMMRKDPAAVPGLAAILLDEQERGALRIEAAHALGEIGGPLARSALEQARAVCNHTEIRAAIDYALTVRLDGRGSTE